MHASGAWVRRLADWLVAIESAAVTEWPISIDTAGDRRTGGPSAEADSGASA